MSCRRPATRCDPGQHEAPHLRRCGASASRSAGADTAAAAARLRPLAHGRALRIGDGVTVELFPAGHILGAAGVVSTVAETIAGGGRVLVPAFALGRAQEVVLTLRHRLPDVPVLVDGMAKEISRIDEQQTADTDRTLHIFGPLVREVRPGRGRREAIASFTLRVVVTTSGMLTAGPAVEWARSILPDPSAALLISGYQDEESPWAALLRLSDGGQDFELDGVPTAVTAPVAKFGLSAHADRDGLTSIIDTVAADQVMLVHGLRSAQQEFAAHLNRRGTATAPTRYWQS